MKRSKKYQQVQTKIEAGKKYTVAEASALLPELSTSKFAGTIDLIVQLNLKEKQKNEMIRGAYQLPNSFGKSAVVLAFVDAANMTKAKDADIKGGEELIAEVEAGKLSFDIVVATPEMMPKIAKLGRVLGTKGLMPSPKNNTVSNEIDIVIEKFKSGSRNFKMDKTGRIAVVAGKSDMKPEQLEENITSVIETIKLEIRRLGPNVIRYIKVSPTMGPSLTVVV